MAAPPVTLRVALIDQEAELVEEVDSIYDEYIITSKYEKDYHRYLMGIAYNSDYSLTTNTGTSLQQSYPIVQLASPTLIWIVDWTCARVNKQPEIPDPFLSNNYAWVLMDEHYEPFMISIATDGVTPVWRLSGTYVYANANPSSITVKDLLFPLPPWLKEFAKRLIPENLLKHGIIDLNAKKQKGLEEQGGLGFGGPVFGS